MKSSQRFCLTIFTFTALSSTPSGWAGGLPEREAVTYQGQLKLGGAPFNGSVDLSFSLWDAEKGGDAVGPSIGRADTPVINGLFTALLDFQVSQWYGGRRWLEVNVDGTTLFPRHEVTPAPYSLQTRGLFVNDFGNVGVGTLDPRHRLTVASEDQETMRLFRSTADFGYGARLNFGDSDYAFIEEDTDDTLQIQANRISLSLRGNGGGALVLANNSGDNSIYLEGYNTTFNDNPAAMYLTGYGGGPIPVLTLRATTTVMEGGEVRLPGGINPAFYPTHFNYAGDGRNYIRGATVLADTGGNVGIGTATPFGVTRLHVFTDSPGYQAVRGDSPDGHGVVGTSNRQGFGAVMGLNHATLVGGIGVYGEAHLRTGAKGVWGASNEGIGVYGTCNSAQTTDSGGVTGRNFAVNGNGVIGEANSGVDAYGVWGRATEGYGVFGSGSWGVVGQGSVFGVFSYGRIQGNSNLFVSGDINAAGNKGFQIDHPDDPENQYLYHYATESPEILNFYSGKVVLDASGEAVVELPRYFAKINKDPRYTLTAVGRPMPNLHISREIDEAALFAGAESAPGRAAPICTFQIAGGASGGKVSWRVEALRNDPYVRAHGAVVETAKPDEERGTYTHPELYGAPPEKATHHRSRMKKP